MKLLAQAQHICIKAGAISVARSFISGSRCPVHKTIEENFVKPSKSGGGAGDKNAGLSGLLRNYNSYRRWIRVTRERNAFEKLALGLADMLTDNSDSKHQDRISTEINKQGEDKVDTVAEIINDFVNSFDTDDNDTIYFISSGAPASWDLQNDVLRAKTKTELIQNRLEKEDKF